MVRLAVLVGVVVAVSWVDSASVAKGESAQGPVSWRPTTVSVDSLHSPTVIPPSALDKPEYHEALPSSANNEVRCDCMFADDDLNSCVDRCGPGHNYNYNCQCNSHCETFNDCCNDYHSVCDYNTGNSGNSGSCEDLTDVTEYFWANDVNRLTSQQCVANLQTRVSDGNSVDRSANSLFSVDFAAYDSHTTIGAFVALLDNYNPSIGYRDAIDHHEQEEIDRFYSLVRASPIFNKLVQYLRCRGHVSSEADFEDKFYNLWFDLYPRSSSSGVLDSSGFEHVMVGELRGFTSVSGFHSWIQFYEEERKGRINYYGYVRNAPHVVGANFQWRPAHSGMAAVKTLGSFFLCTSPQFDLALYTLCAFEHTDALCPVRLGGISYSIQTWDIGHKAGLQIASAYPSL